MTLPSAGRRFGIPSVTGYATPSSSQMSDDVSASHLTYESVSNNGSCKSKQCQGWITSLHGNMLKPAEHSHRNGALLSGQARYSNIPSSKSALSSLEAIRAQPSVPMPSHTDYAVKSTTLSGLPLLLKPLSGRTVE